MNSTWNVSISLWFNPHSFPGFPNYVCEIPIICWLYPRLHHYSIFPLWCNDICVFVISHGDFPEKNRTMVSPCIILLGCILMLIPFNAQMIIRNIISFISFTVSLYCPISSVSCAPQFFMVDTICWKRISDDITTTSKKMQPCLITILAWFSCSIVWSLL